MLFVNLLSSVFFFLTLKFITSWQAVLRGSKHPVPRVASFRVVARQQQRTAVNKMMYRAPPLIETAAPWRCFVGETFQWNISEFESTRLACFRNDSKRKGACAACGCRVASSCIIVLQILYVERCNNFGGKRVNLVLSDFNHLLGVGKQRFYVFWGFIVILVGVWTIFWTGLKQNKWNELIRHSLCDSPAALSLVRLEPVYQLGRVLPMGWNVTTTEIFSHAFLSSVHIPSGLLCYYHCDSFAKYLMRSKNWKSCLVIELFSFEHNLQAVRILVNASTQISICQFPRMVPLFDVHPLLTIK